jgi:hypothetical protein
MPIALAALSLPTSSTLHDLLDGKIGRLFAIENFSNNLTRLFGGAADNCSLYFCSARPQT